MKVPPKSIFICYRRDDSADATGRLYDRLEKGFPGGVMRDVNDIPLGVDFRDHVKKVLASCRVVLVIIGPAWAAIKNGAGKLRLDDPQDPVRLEIEHALSRKDIRVIPVLVGGAEMSKVEAALPSSLKQLAFKSGLEVRRDPDFHKDVDLLIQQMEIYLKTKDNWGWGITIGVVGFVLMAAVVQEGNEWKKNPELVRRVEEVREAIISLEASNGDANRELTAEEYKRVLRAGGWVEERDKLMVYPDPHGIRSYLERLARKNEVDRLEAMEKEAKIMIGAPFFR